jgi:hypothetical protein
MATLKARSTTIHRLMDGVLLVALSTSTQTGWNWDLSESPELQIVASNEIASWDRPGLRFETVKNAGSQSLRIFPAFWPHGSPDFTACSHRSASAFAVFFRQVSYRLRSRNFARGSLARRL